MLCWLVVSFWVTDFRCVLVNSVVVDEEVCKCAWIDAHALMYIHVPCIWYLTNSIFHKIVSLFDEMICVGVKLQGLSMYIWTISVDAKMIALWNLLTIYRTGAFGDFNQNKTKTNFFVVPFLSFRFTIGRWAWKNAAGKKQRTGSNYKATSIVNWRSSTRNRGEKLILCRFNALISD